jgi:hypothetical protein
MKRMLLVLAIMCLATGAFAVDVSLGIGASGAYYSTDLKASLLGAEAESNLTRVPWDFMAYADMTYLQIAVGYRIVRGAHEKDTDPTGTTETDFNKFSANWVSFAVFGKFPMPIGSITFFPMIGVEYDMTLSGTFDDGTDWDSKTKSDQNEFWIKGGVGLDITVGPRVYIRPEFMIGYKLLNKPEKDQIDSLKAGGFTDVSLLDLSFEASLLVGVRL